MSLLLNPWTWLVALVTVLALMFGSYRYGVNRANDKWEAKAGLAALQVESKEDARDLSIDAIGSATREGVLAALNDNRTLGNERTERIRTVVVPSDCRPVDPTILRELQDAAAGINSALRVGLRPDATPAGSGHR